MSLRIIPVIDLMNGLAVRGVAGRRDQYRPIISQLTPSAKLLDVAAALVERFLILKRSISPILTLSKGRITPVRYCLSLVRCQNQSGLMQEFAASIKP